MEKLLSKDLNDFQIRLQYSAKALKVPMWMGIGFCAWGLFSFFNEGGSHSDINGLLSTRNWPIVFGLVYLINYWYMKVFGFMVISRFFIKRLGFFQKKIAIDQIESCRLTGSDLIIKSIKRDLYVSSSVVSKESYEYLLKFLKEQRIPFE